MRRLVILAALGLASCGSEPTAEERERMERAAIAEVEANQIPPPDPVDPQAMTFADFERNGILGMGCSFLPSGEGENPVAITMGEGAYLKIDGEISRLAPDAGSAEAPYGTRAKYDGKRLSMQLEIEPGDGEQIGTETIEHDARLILSDGRDRIVYEARGRAHCGA